MRVQYALASTLDPATLTEARALTPNSIKAVKSVKFGYTPTPMTRALLEAFRDMDPTTPVILRAEALKSA